MSNSSISSEERLSNVEHALLKIAGSNESINDEIELYELWQALWNGKWIVIIVTLIFSLTSVLYALSIPNEYKSTVLLAPASSSDSSSLSKLAGQLGGLASIAGVNLGGRKSNDKSIVAMEIIKTWGFLEMFISDNSIEVELFAAKGWNKSSNELIIDSEIFDVENSKWVREYDPMKGETAEPSSWELYQELKDRVSINQNQDNGIIMLSCEFYSPIVAKEWLDKLVKAINQHIQRQDWEDANKNIEYLKLKIEETNVANMQSVFYQLIEEQTKTLMLAEVSDEYVFKTLSAAKVAAKKSNPNRFLICIIGFVIGLTLASIFVLVRYFANRKMD